MFARDKIYVYVIAKHSTTSPVRTASLLDYS